MITIGLTGSVGMGKSTTARLLRTLKIPVFDADAWIHRSMNRGGEAVAAVTQKFPAAYDAVSKKIDRKILGQIVFNDKSAKHDLEGILHPLVRAAEERFMTRHRGSRAPIIVLDIPLLFETGADHLCDVTVVVTAPKFMQRARVMRRPNMTVQKFAAILAAQMPDDQKRARADFVVHTGLGRAHTMRDLHHVLHAIKQNYV